MNRRTDRERQRRRERDLELLRFAIDSDGAIFSTDRRVRRLVERGFAENPDYAYGAARNATAWITEAGRRFVEEAAK